MLPPQSAVAAAETAAQSPPSSSTNTQTCEADRAVFWATKFRNYVLFIQALAVYIPSAQPWATSLSVCPLVAFKMQVASYFSEAINKHRAGDNQGRDLAASAIVRQQAHAHGLELSKLRAPDLVKLFRFASLFALLVAEDAQ